MLPLTDEGRVGGVIGFLFLKRLGRALEEPGDVNTVHATVDTRTLARLLYALDTKRNGKPSEDQLSAARYVLKAMEEGKYVPDGWSLVESRRVARRRVLKFRYTLQNPEDPAKDLLRCARWVVM